jgi:hypothetical protein
VDVRHTPVIFRMVVATIGKSNETRKTSRWWSEGQVDCNEFESHWQIQLLAQRSISSLDLNRNLERTSSSLCWGCLHLLKLLG